MNSETVRKKVARLRCAGKPRVLDLFAGCGGLSLGFQAAAFDLRAAVEFDPDAARSHGLNFHGGDPKHSEARDIIATSPDGAVETIEAELLLIHNQAIRVMHEHKFVVVCGDKYAELPYRGAAQGGCRESCSHSSEHGGLLPGANRGPARGAFRRTRAAGGGGDHPQAH